MQILTKILASETTWTVLEYVLVYLANSVETTGVRIGWIRSTSTWLPVDLVIT